MTGALNIGYEIVYYIFSVGKGGKGYQNSDLHYATSHLSSCYEHYELLFRYKLSDICRDTDAMANWSDVDRIL